MRGTGGDREGTGGGGWVGFGRGTGGDRDGWG